MTFGLTQVFRFGDQFRSFADGKLLAAKIRRMFSSGELGAFFDPSDRGSLYQEWEGELTTLANQPGDPVGTILDRSGNGNHAVAASDAARRLLGKVPATGRRNLLLSTDTLASQVVVVANEELTMSFVGNGTVTMADGTDTWMLAGQSSGRVSFTFTPQAGDLTITVVGTVQKGQLELGAEVTAYQRVGSTALDVSESGVAVCWYLARQGDPSMDVEFPDMGGATMYGFASESGIAIVEGLAINGAKQLPDMDKLFGAVYYETEFSAKERELVEEWLCKKSPYCDELVAFYQPIVLVKSDGTVYVDDDGVPLTSGFWLMMPQEQ